MQLRPVIKPCVGKPENPLTKMKNRPKRFFPKIKNSAAPTAKPCFRKAIRNALIAAQDYKTKKAAPTGAAFYFAF